LQKIASIMEHGRRALIATPGFPTTWAG